jgi:hypothetical protein
MRGTGSVSAHGTRRYGCAVATAAGPTASVALAPAPAFAFALACAFGLAVGDEAAAADEANAEADGEADTAAADDDDGNGRSEGADATVSIVGDASDMTTGGEADTSPPSASASASLTMDGDSTAAGETAFRFIYSRQHCCGLEGRGGEGSPVTGRTERSAAQRSGENGIEQFVCLSHTHTHTIASDLHITARNSGTDSGGAQWTEENAKAERKEQPHSKQGNRTRNRTDRKREKATERGEDQRRREERIKHSK